MRKIVSAKRVTTESTIAVELDFSGLKPDYRKQIQTGITFLNHMIEHIAWRSGINIAVRQTLDEFQLTHVICEDCAMTIGKAVADYVDSGKLEGVTGYGDGIGIIDEAYASCAISFEGRAGLYFDSKIPIPDQTEGMLSEDILTFLEGFVQGASCTLHIRVEQGKNGHHIWEAVYRGLGIALGRALAVDAKRVGLTAGVAGKVDYQVN